LIVAFALAAVQFSPGLAGAAEFHGLVTHVSDGDTLWVRLEGSAGKAVKLRRQGIDAPERCQPWGPQAAAALRGHVLQRRVRVQTRATDVYRRTMARVSLDGEDIGAWLTRQGHAWNDGYARRPGPYAAQEQLARIAGLGLFADRLAIESRLFRKRFGARP
jgi:endonuclease YncB( thermonuclease family)